MPLPFSLESITDDDVLAIEKNLPSDGVMSDATANTHWNNLFTALQITDLDEMLLAAGTIYAYIIENTTSPQQSFNGKVTIGTVECTMREVLNYMRINSSDWRRFARAKCNIVEIKHYVKRKPVIEKLEARIATAGYGTEHYLAVLDIADLLDLPQSTKAVAARISSKRLVPNANTEMLTRAAVHRQETPNVRQPPNPVDDMFAR
jgi:hypothetical protein